MTECNPVCFETRLHNDLTGSKHDGTMIEKNRCFALQGRSEGACLRRCVGSGQVTSPRRFVDTTLRRYVGPGQVATWLGSKARQCYDCKNKNNSHKLHRSQPYSRAGNTPYRQKRWFSETSNVFCSKSQTVR